MYIYRTAQFSLLEDDLIWYLSDQIAYRLVLHTIH